MSRAGEEMIFQLSKLLTTDTVKTAAKKEEKEEDKKEDKETKEEKKDKKKEDKEEKSDKKDKDEKKEEKKSKKAEVMMNVVGELVALANELDESGATEASDLVDDALQVIIKNIQKSAFKSCPHIGENGEPAHIHDECVMDDVDMDHFEEEFGGHTDGNEEGMGTRLEHTLQDAGQPKQESTPEGLGMNDFNEHGAMEDNIDRLLADPNTKEMLKSKLNM